MKRRIVFFFLFLLTIEFAFSAPVPAIILLGAPGSGKGTQSDLLCQQFQIPAISTGQIIRNHIKMQTSLGQEASIYVNKGQLVPVPLVEKILKNRFSQNDCSNGFIIEGSYYTVERARSLESMLPNHVKPVVIFLRVEESNLRERILGRLLCSFCERSYHKSYLPPLQEDLCDLCGEKLQRRLDDSEEIFTLRYSSFSANIAELCEYYQKKEMLWIVDGNAEVQEVFSKIKKILF